MRVLDDAAVRPDLFIWRGPVPLADLEAWIREKELRVPNDLVHFWEVTGGGEVFETESLLGPRHVTELSDDVAAVTRAHRERGMPADYIVFHVGLGGLSAVSSRDGRYVSLDENTYTVAATFSSFDDWYLSLLRQEYADRYRL
jgi:hypothetical protein